MRRSAMLGSFFGGAVAMCAAAMASGCSRSAEDRPVAMTGTRAAVARFDAIASAFAWGPALGRSSSELFGPRTFAYEAREDAIVSEGSRVRFARYADGALELESAGVASTVRMLGVAHVGAEATRGHLLYRAVGDGRDVIARPIEGGSEDWVVVAAERAGASVDYEVRLGRGVAGLRLVARTLELLDAGGAPRLRMAAPYLVDSAGTVRPAHVDVVGCNLDRSPRAPFGRPVVTPGAEACRVRVSWDPSKLVYPAVVDPAWTSTMQLAAPRHGHVAVLLPGAPDRVLVAGGQTTDPVSTSIEVTTAEIWSQGAWATTGSLATARDAAASALLGGEVLVSGGLTNMGMDVLGTAEIYDPATGMWRTTGSLAVPRAGHSATPLGDDSVLVSAGYDNSGDHFREAERYDPALGMFVPAGKINTTRYFQTAVALSGGRVLVGGGTDPESGALASLELYTLGTGWASAASLAPMPAPRTLHASAVLMDGTVLFAGGYNATDEALARVDRYDPSTNTWTTVGPMARARFDLASAPLPDGRVLFVAGQSLVEGFSDGELFDPATLSFQRFRGAALRAYGHTATALSDGRAIAVGGRNPGPILVASAEIFDPALPTIDAGPEDAGSDAQGDAAIEADSAVADAGALPDAAARPDASPAPSGTANDAGSLPPGQTTDAALSELQPLDGTDLAGGGCGISGGAGGTWWATVSALLVLGALRRSRRRP